MRNIVLVAILTLAAATQLSAFTREQALKDPFILRFENETGMTLAPELKKAMANAHWQKANDMLFNETVTKKYGDKKVKSVDVQGAIAEFIKAGKDGIVLASWQGLNISKTLAPLRGNWFDAVVPVLSEQLSGFGVCQGYEDLAAVTARGYGENKPNYRSAANIMLSGKEACNRPSALAWQKQQWARHYYKYKAMADHPEALKYKVKK